MFVACANAFWLFYIYISYLGYIYILGWLIGWIPAVPLADARSFIADDYPIRPTLWLVDDLLYRDILPRSRMGIIYVLTSVDAGKQVGGIQLDSSKIYYLFVYLFAYIYCYIWCVRKINNSLLCVFKYHWAWILIYKNIMEGYLRFKKEKFYF